MQLVLELLYCPPVICNVAPVPIDTAEAVPEPTVHCSQTELLPVPLCVTAVVLRAEQSTLIDVSCKTAVDDDEIGDAKELFLSVTTPAEFVEAVKELPLFEN